MHGVAGAVAAEVGADAVAGSPPDLADRSGDVAYPASGSRGERLGALLRQARGARSTTEIAAASGVPVESLRKIEAGRIATPAFFTVAALPGSRRLA
jgi:hypothetical protein